MVFRLTLVRLRLIDLMGNGDLQTQLDAKAPKASPDFTGTVDLTGTTISLDNDQISGQGFWWNYL